MIDILSPSSLSPLSSTTSPGLLRLSVTITYSGRLLLNSLDVVIFGVGTNWMGGLISSVWLSLARVVVPPPYSSMFLFSIFGISSDKLSGAFVSIVLSQVSTSVEDLLSALSRAFESDSCIELFIFNLSLLFSSSKDLRVKQNYMRLLPNLHTAIL